jgi:hypothetical protein
MKLGASGFTSPSKEGVLRISIALKNPSHRPGLNPHTAKTTVEFYIHKYITSNWRRKC